jgi:hypothetical protein
VIQKPALGGVYYYSMALVIMGGLFVSTVLTTVLLPTMSSVVEDSFGWIGRKLGFTVDSESRTGMVDTHQES